MKIPKIFTPDKNLDKRIEQLLSEKVDMKGHDEKTVGELLKKCRTFINRQAGVSNLENTYQIGERLADELEFTKEDVEESVQRIRHYSEKDRYSGFYFSALINKIITKKDVVNLNFYEELAGLGAYLKTGTLILDGYVGFALGHCMEGGTIITKKDAGSDVGNGMLNGRIIINGNTGHSTGIFSKGGDIIVYGNIEKIADTCKARIFKGDKQIWPK